MSRRKQSNPKPFKRLSDDEDDEADMKSTDSTKSEREAVSSCQSSDQIHMHSESCVKSEPASPEVQEDIEGDTNEDEKPPVIFLNDVLLLKKVDKDEAQQLGRSFLVCAAIPLPRGSSIGPFDAEIVSLSSIKQGDTVLQAQDENEETSFVRVEDPCATWLTMLRPAPSESVRNTSVFYKGGQVWCEIISKLHFGAELLSSFTIEDSNKSEPCSPDSTDFKEKEQEIEMDIKPEVKTPPSLMPASTVTNNSAINHAALLYGCPFCGVRFSSARTLEGHLTYYCSKKPSNINKDNDASKQDRKEENDTGKHMSPEDSNSSCTDQEKQDSESVEEQPQNVTSDTKILKTGEVFHCPFCCYTSDKLSSLNRHKRIHSRGSNSPTSSTSSLSPISKQDSYCGDCNIQFSSYSTFKCHKDYYCSKRLDGISMSGALTTSSNNRDFPHFPFHDQLSPTGAKNLKQLMAGSSGSLISGQTNVILAPPIVARGILNIPFGMPTVIVQPVVPPSPSQVSPGNTTQTKIKPKTETYVDQPLDLSVSKKTTLDDSDKENRSSPSNEIPPERSLKKDDIKTPSRSRSPSISPLNSPKQQERSLSSNSAEETPSPVPSTPTRISPFISVAPVQFINGKPIPPVPHSVSKCVDCNIVFYKHENFIIHKKHYCSSRQARSNSDNLDECSKDSSDNSIQTIKRKASELEVARQPSPDDRLLDSEKSRSPKSGSEDVEHEKTKTASDKEIKPNSSTCTTKASLGDSIDQFFCKPCKIRFSSASTLSAHKEFYCPYSHEDDKFKGGENNENISETFINGVDMAAKCDRCGTTFPSIKVLRLHYCTGIATHVPLLRCPYCDYVTQTETRISEHLKVHMPSKAYRCTICGYRGNTVRGMRMHGKMHIDSGEEFSDDNMVEIEEPPLVPIIFNSPTETTSTNVEAELIRMKNEPYKRRRSRKSYEKSEHMGNIRSTTPKNICVFCGQSFNDNASLAIHIRIHEMVAFHAASSRNMKCHFCDHVAETFPSLMIHVENKHLKDVNTDKIHELEHTPATSPKRTITGSDNDIDSSPKCSRIESSRPNSADTHSLREGRQVSKTDNQSPKGFSPDDERERTLNLLNLTGKIKKEPIESTPGERDKTQKENVNNNEPFRKRKHSPVESSDEKLHPQSTSPPDKKFKIDATIIKSEKINGSDEASSPLRSPVLTPELARYYQLAMQVMPPLIVPRVPSRPLPSPSERTEKLTETAKYCKYCDISFTYLSTYIAHKKYYCTARQPDEITSPAKA